MLLGFLCDFNLAREMIQITKQLWLEERREKKRTEKRKEKVRKGRRPDLCCDSVLRRIQKIRHTLWLCLTKVPYAEMGAAVK